MFFSLERHEVAIGVNQRGAHAARSNVNGQKQIARAHRIQILRYVAFESMPSAPSERHILAPLHTEPLPERLCSGKISRALWLVGFSG